MATGDLAQRVRAWAQTPAVQAARLRGGDLDALGVGAVLDLVSLEHAACLAADDAALRPEEALRQARVSAELRLPLEDESEPDEDVRAACAVVFPGRKRPHEPAGADDEPGICLTPKRARPNAATDSTELEELLRSIDYDDGTPPQPCTYSAGMEMSGTTA